MVLPIIEGLAAIVLPFFILKIKDKKLFSAIGVVGTSYLFGLIFSLVLFALSFFDFMPERDTSILEVICYLAVALGIALLLFNSNLASLKKCSKSALLSFAILIFSVLLVSFLVYVLFAKSLQNGDIFCSMAVALYTGGTPNSNTVGLLYNLDSTSLFVANLSDILFGGLFYAFLLFLAKPAFGWLFKSIGCSSQEVPEIKEEKPANKSVKPSLVEYLKSFLIALGCVAISTLIGLLLWIIFGSQDGMLTSFLIPAMMIGTTVLGIAFSFSPMVKGKPSNEGMSEYFVAVFSFSIASMLDFTSLSLLSFEVFAIFASITFASFILHVVVCRIFKIDLDLTLVSFSAGIYGPAFIPSICRSAKSKKYLSSGLILGSLGYAIGTFLAILFNFVLQLIG